MALFLESQSFRTRLTLQWLVVFGFLLSLSFIVVYFGLRRSLYHSLEDSLRTLAGTEIASSMDGPEVHLHPIETSAIINSHHIEKFVQILTPEYTVINQSRQLRSRQPLISRKTMQSALAGAAVMTDVDLDGVKGLGLSANAHGQYVFVVAVSVSDIESALASLRRTLWIVGVVILGTTALAGYGLATAALRPVDLMTQRAQSIGRGHLKARLVEPTTNDELSRLACVLNEMLDRLYAIIESHQRFAADASHELRSPLTSLRGRLEVALRRERSANEYRQVILASLSEVDRLTTLAEDLLDLSRSDIDRLPLDLTEFPLWPVVREEIQKVKTVADLRGLEINTEEDEALTLIADETRLRRVIHNLLNNAIHYGKTSGGKVWITADMNDHGFWIEIRDNGIGISEEEKQHVFERFWRADQARAIRRSGGGLGLAISQEIVRAHGGQILVSSKLGEGSTFKVWLPSQIEAAD